MRLLAVLLLTTACSTYSVRRAALVPHMAPVGSTGQPMSEPVDVSIGTTNLVSAGPPTEGSADAGLYIPRVDLNGGLRARIGDASIGLLLDFGSGSDATATSTDMPRPEGDTYGGGVMFGYSFGQPGQSFRLGMEIDLLRYSVPWRETWTCIEDCEFSTMPAVVDGRNGVTVVAVGLVPSWRMERWTFFGGATIRNHPTIDKGDIINFEIYDPIEGGPVNLVASAGAEIDLVGTLRLTILAFAPIGSPVAYSPTLSARLTFGLPTSGPDRLAP